MSKQIGAKRKTTQKTGNNFNKRQKMSSKPTDKHQIPDNITNKSVLFLKAMYGENPTFNNIVDGFKKSAILSLLGADIDVKQWGVATWSDGSKVTYSDITNLDGIVQSVIAPKTDETEGKKTVMSMKRIGLKKEVETVVVQMDTVRKAFTDYLNELTIQQENTMLRAAVNGASSDMKARKERQKAVVQPNTRFCYRVSGTNATYPYCDGSTLSDSMVRTQMSKLGALVEYNAVYRALLLGPRELNMVNADYQKVSSYWKAKAIEPFTGIMKSCAKVLLENAGEPGVGAALHMFYRLSPIRPPRINALQTASMAAHWFTKAKPTDTQQKIYKGIKAVYEYVYNENPWVTHGKISLEYAATMGLHHVDLANSIKHVWNGAKAGWITLVGKYGMVGSTFAFEMPYVKKTTVQALEISIPDVQTSFGQLQMDNTNTTICAQSFAGRINEDNPNAGVILVRPKEAGINIENIHDVEHWLSDVEKCYKVSKTDTTPIACYLLADHIEFTGNPNEILDHEIFSNIRTLGNLQEGRNSMIYASACYEAQNTESVFKEMAKPHKETLEKFWSYKLAGIKKYAKDTTAAYTLGVSPPKLYTYMVTTNNDDEMVVLTDYNIADNFLKNFWTYPELLEAGFAVSHVDSFMAKDHTPTYTRGIPDAATIKKEDEKHKMPGTKAKNTSPNPSSSGTSSMAMQQLQPSILSVNANMDWQG